MDRASALPPLPPSPAQGRGLETHTAQSLQPYGRCYSFTGV